MTCGTHTTANVTAAVFGFNPLLSGSFLKQHDSCECTICSLLEESPLPCPAGGATGTDTQIVILTLALSFNFFSFGFVLVSQPTALRVRWTRRSSWCPFTVETMEACCLILSSFRHHPSASSSRRKVIANTHSFLRVCAFVCECACVCIYI